MPVSTGSGSDESLTPCGRSRRELLKSGRKAVYVAPALLLLNPVITVAQIGSPPCDPNDPQCVFGTSAPGRAPTIKPGRVPTRKPGRGPKD